MRGFIIVAVVFLHSFPCAHPHSERRTISQDLVIEQLSGEGENVYRIHGTRLGEVSRRAGILRWRASLVDIRIDLDRLSWALVEGNESIVQINWISPSRHSWPDYNIRYRHWIAVPVEFSAVDRSQRVYDRVECMVFVYPSSNLYNRPIDESLRFETGRCLYDYRQASIFHTRFFYGGVDIEGIIVSPNENLASYRRHRVRDIYLP